jgi:hypothetical protein
VSSFCDPGLAPAGDVGTAMLFIDSRLKAASGEDDEADLQRRQLTEQLLRSFDSAAARDVLDGVCTIIYVLIRWLDAAHKGDEHDVIAGIVPYVVTGLRAMDRTVQPEGIPTMAALLVASATRQSPTLWRQQYGPWGRAEITALEATTLLVADYVNKVTGDDDTATRIIMDVLTAAEDDASG